MRHSLFTRIIAVTLCAAFLLTVPGSGSWAAAAQLLQSAAVNNAGVLPVVPQGLGTGLPIATGYQGLAGSSLSGLSGVLPTVGLPTPMTRTVVGSASAAASAARQPAAQPRSLTAPAAVAGAQVSALSFKAPAAVVPHADLTRPAAGIMAQKLTAPLRVIEKSRGQGIAASFGSLSSLYDGGRGAAALDEAVGAQAGKTAPRLAPGTAQDSAAQPQTPAPQPAPAPAGKVFSLPVTLLLGAAGAASAFFFLPGALAFAPVLSGLAASHPLVAAISSAFLGFAFGASLSEAGLWVSWPGEAAAGARTAGGTAFRFWARFGLVFRAVLTASSMEEAMKAELPASILRYPVLAMPFVLLGYLSVPIFGLFGLVYKAAEIPVRAAWRATQRVLVGLIPALAQVFEFLGRLIRRVIPAAGAAIVSAAKAAMASAAAGAVSLAAPVWTGVVTGRYAVDKDWDSDWLSAFPRMAGMLALRALGFLTAAVLAVVGGSFGLVTGLPAVLVSGTLAGLARVSDGGRIAQAKARWDRSLDILGDTFAFHEVGSEVSPRQSVGVARVVVRLLNAPFAAAAALPAVVLTGLAVTGRALAAAFGRETERTDGGQGDAALEGESRAPLAGKGRGFSVTAQESEADPAEPARTSVWTVLALGSIFAVGGWFGAPMLVPFIPAVLLAYAGGAAWAVSAAAAAAGFSLGLAVSQPGVWRGLFTGAARTGREAAGDSFRVWARLGLAADSGLRSRRVDETLFRDAPSRIGAYPVLAMPAVLAGYVFSAAAAVSGAAVSAAGVFFEAAWRGLVVLLTSGLIRRVLRGLKEVLKRAIPFAAGFVVGGLTGILQMAAGGAAVLGAPVWRNVIGDRGELRYRYTGLTGLVLKRLVQFIGGLGTVAAGAAGLVLGVIYGAPAWILTGVAKGMSWSGRGQAEQWLSRWKRSFRSIADDAGERLVGLAYPGVKQEAGLFQGVVRTANGLLYAASAVLWGLPLVLSLVLRASRKASAPEGKEAVRPEGAASSETVERPRPAGWLATVAREAGDAWTGTRGFWSNSAEAFAYAAGRAEAGPVLGLGVALVGTAAALVFTPAAALAGAVETPARAVLGFLRRIAERFLPFIRRVLNLLGRIAKRVFPFLGGAIAGAVGGVFGSALFGALLLGRPWFKYVAAPDYDTSSIGRFLGVSALRIVSGLAGVVFGVLGLAFGLLAAFPYSLTFMVAVAFDWGGIGGASEKFFQHWKRGALPAEMRRINKLTDSFEFPGKKEGEELAPMDGWVRLGMITAATLAATFAATVAGFVAYVRSVRSAGRAVRAGDPIPSEGWVSGDVVGRTARRGGRIGSKVVGRVAALAGIAAAAAGFFGLISLGGLGWLATNTGLLALLFLSGPVGWVVGGLVGAALGVFVGILFWLDRLLAAGPAER
ncbi:MAG: hypothetical protein A2X36_06155 [Elusimicrobia bacterium GWA2_69_24]|nr:MAG: hypothetical protein A2X36_06155 [Elusimicrobia bacterium GWA2_69_24]